MSTSPSILPHSQVSSQSALHIGSALVMKFPLPADTFPPLVLSQEDRSKLEAAAEAVVKSAIGQYHDHLTVHNSEVDEKRWKKIRQREDVRVYRERRASLDETSSTSSSESSSSEDASDPVSLAALLIFGSIQGRLDDVMYGVLSASTEEMQLKTAYVEDGFVDWGLLASIIKPSKQDPFRELSLKWTVKRHPMLTGAVMRTGDTVYMESSGIAQTPNGERIGYHLYHSVDIPEIRELTEFNIVRAKFTACEFYRQRKPECVEVYARSMLNPVDNVPRILVALTTSEVAISVLKHAHYAEMKKLTRRATSKHRSLTVSRAASLPSIDGDNYSPESVPVSDSAMTCAVCSRKVGGGLSFAYPRDKSCRICLARVCSRCCVYKTIHLPTKLEKQLTSVEMAFCTRCIRDTTHASSAKFAVLDALAAEGKVVDCSDALGY